MYTIYYITGYITIRHRTFQTEIISLTFEKRGEYLLSYAKNDENLALTSMKSFKDKLTVVENSFLICTDTPILVCNMRYPTQQGPSIATHTAFLLARFVTPPFLPLSLKRMHSRQYYRYTCRSRTDCTVNPFTHTFTHTITLTHSGNEAGQIQIWVLDVSTKRDHMKVVLTGHRGHSITALRFSQSGIFIASGAADGSVCVWNVEYAVLVHSCPVELNTQPVASLDWYPNIGVLILRKNVKVSPTPPRSR